MNGLFEMRVTNTETKPICFLLEEMFYIAQKLGLVVKCRYLGIDIDVFPDSDLVQLKALYQKVRLGKVIERQAKAKMKKQLKLIKAA